MDKVDTNNTCKSALVDISLSFFMGTLHVLVYKPEHMDMDFFCLSTFKLLVSSATSPPGSPISKYSPISSSPSFLFLENLTPFGPSFTFRVSSSLSSFDCGGPSLEMATFSAVLLAGPINQSIFIP